MSVCCEFHSDNYYLIGDRFLGTFPLGCHLEGKKDFLCFVHCIIPSFAKRDVWHKLANKWMHFRDDVQWSAGVNLEQHFLTATFQASHAHLLQ